MAFSRTIRKFARKCGLDVGRFHPEDSADLRRARYIRDLGVDLVLDVGANTGGYARHLRSHGYLGRILSFEPLSAAYAELNAASQADPLWTCRNIALGDRTGEAIINIASNSASSSLLDMADRHVGAAPESAYVGRETIGIDRLDGIYPGLAGDATATLLKIDTQGLEHEVLRGAEQSLADIALLEIELSFTELYENQTMAEELLAHLRRRNFVLISVERGFTDPDNFHILQCDAILINTAHAQPAGVDRP